MVDSTQRIRVGIGGWTFEPWRDNFFPAGLPHTQELHFASRAVTAIEVNGTYYSTQSPKSFARWRDETPDDFVFSLKANRFATNRRVLAEAGDSIQRFVESGLSELGQKLGPLVWQFAPTKQFDPVDFGAFLELLPKAVDGLALRHVLDVRHASFMVPAYLALARRYGCATVFADSDKFPSFADVTGDFVYARLMQSQPDCATGYEAETLARWADVARDWARGATPAGAPLVEPAHDSGAARDVFVYFINGAKERAPAAAQALIARLRTG
ncbi:DUF72 domain-containing protein [Pseudorhodoferax sp. Leaf267]|uniref:DUF72 domain-containing protein n=1 Tax=Pseudorhodoferax sp. Leaf267 TaxID=1736316 RepID=UPI0006FC3F12|nr:DUF72 domain-containing protein [Pseudorhodoferax sp. Leaf267]KQP12692.1 hypothetical protein ASF43_20900 [Pseudorhodoferax sp. Leaf267]